MSVPQREKVKADFGASRCIAICDVLPLVLSLAYRLRGVTFFNGLHCRRPIITSTSNHLTTDARCVGVGVLCGDVMQSTLVDITYYQGGVTKYTSLCHILL